MAQGTPEDVNVKTGVLTDAFKIIGMDKWESGMINPIPNVPLSAAKFGAALNNNSSAEPVNGEKQGDDEPLPELASSSSFFGDSPAMVDVGKLTNPISSESASDDTNPVSEPIVLGEFDQLFPFVPEQPLPEDAGLSKAMSAVSVDGNPIKSFADFGRIGPNLIPVAEDFLLFEKQLLSVLEQQKRAERAHSAAKSGSSSSPASAAPME